MINKKVKVIIISEFSVRTFSVSIYNLKSLTIISTLRQN